MYNSLGFDADFQKLAEDPEAYAKQQGGELLDQGIKQGAQYVEQQTGLPATQVTGGPASSTSTTTTSSAAPSRQLYFRRPDPRTVASLSPLARRTSGATAPSARGPVTAAPSTTTAGSAQAQVAYDAPVTGGGTAPGVPAAPPPAEEKPFPWLYVGVGVGVLAIGAAAWFLTKPAKATPNKRRGSRHGKKKP